MVISACMKRLKLETCVCVYQNRIVQRNLYGPISRFSPPGRLLSLGQFVPCVTSARDRMTNGELTGVPAFASILRWLGFTPRERVWPGRVAVRDFGLMADMRPTRARLKWRSFARFSYKTQRDFYRIRDKFWCFKRGCAGTRTCYDEVIIDFTTAEVCESGILIATPAVVILHM